MDEIVLFFRPPSKEIYHLDFLQRWLEDQLTQFCTQIKQTPPVLKKKLQRFSGGIENDSSEDELEIIHDQTYPIVSQKKFIKRPSHLNRHQSLKNQNRPLLFDNTHRRQRKSFSRRTDSTSMPRSELSSDLQSSRPENLSESLLSNLGSEYDNMSAQDPSNLKANSDDDDDEPTLTSTTNHPRCYF